MRTLRAAVDVEGENSGMEMDPNPGNGKEVDKSWGGSVRVMAKFPLVNLVASTGVDCLFLEVGADTSVRG